jgi:uncharacterized membrane protein
MPHLSMTDNARLMSVARASLSGCWQSAALVTALSALILMACHLLPVFGSLAQLLLIGPLQLGLARYLLQTVRGGRPSTSVLFSGFDQFGRALAVYLLSMLLMALPMVLLVSVYWGVAAALGVPSGESAMHSIAAAVAFCAVFSIWLALCTFIWIALGMSYFILVDAPQTGAVAALRQSRAMMRGNMRKFFALVCRFTGWFLLCLVTFGIASFWVYPYFAAASIHFYEEIRDRPAAPEARAAGGEPFAYIDFGD